MLSAMRIEPMPTYNQCLSEAKNSKSPTTLTPRPRCFKNACQGDVNFTKLVVRFSEITKKCLPEAKQIYTRQFIIILVILFRQD